MEAKELHHVDSVIAGIPFTEREMVIYEHRILPDNRIPTAELLSQPAFALRKSTGHLAEKSLVSATHNLRLKIQRYFIAAERSPLEAALAFGWVARGHKGFESRFGEAITELQTRGTYEAKYVLAERLLKWPPTPVAEVAAHLGTTAGRINHWERRIGQWVASVLTRSPLNCPNFPRLQLFKPGS